VSLNSIFSELEKTLIVIVGTFEIRLINDLETVSTNLLFKFADDAKLIEKVGNTKDR